MDEVWTSLLGQFKDSPLVLLCLAWIITQQRTIISLQKRNTDLEAHLRTLNEKIQADIVPLLTRLLDLVPDLLAQVRRRK